MQIARSKGVEDVGLEEKMKNVGEEMVDLRFKEANMREHLQI